MTNVREAVAWLGYTYLFVRMKKNPLAYGIPWDELAIEPDLLERRRTLITNAARELERSKMARYLGPLQLQERETLQILVIFSIYFTMSAAQ